MEMLVEIISALIGAAGAIIAAVVAALITGGYISKVFENNISPLFATYSDETHDAHRLMRKAKHNIYIVAAVGDRFLVKYENHLESYLKKGVKLRFLIQGQEQYFALEHYVNNRSNYQFLQYLQTRHSALAILSRLQSKYPDCVEVKEFASFLTASYIGIDIEESVTSPQWSAHGIIQVMLYQYGVASEKSPITYFSLKDNKRLFEGTANSIAEMWHDGRTIEIDNRLLFMADD